MPRNDSGDEGLTLFHEQDRDFLERTIYSTGFLLIVRKLGRMERVSPIVCGIFKFVERVHASIAMV